MPSWMVINISLRLEAFLDKPIRVNIDVKQHSLLKFIAVTIYNKNSLQGVNLGQTKSTDLLEIDHNQA